MEFPKEKKTRNVRRKKVEINNSLLAAAKNEVIEKGFHNTTIVGIADRAKIQTSVFYYRYKDLDDIFDKLIRPYDYWLENSVPFTEGDTILQIENAISNLIDSLGNDALMQKILIWELIENNYSTQRASCMRELFYNYLMGKLQNKIKCNNINILNAVIIGGIYYILLHRNESKFCGIDFCDELEIENLKTTIGKIYNSVVSKTEEEQGLKTASVMLKYGIDIEIIQNCTGLSKDLIQQITSSKNEPQKKEDY